MLERGLAYIDGDTVISAGTWQAALDAAGAVCQAVEDVIDEKTNRAFCAVRPPGHHAEPMRANGFCLFNNVVIGALHARARGVGRIAVVDFDVHHGNGSNAIALLHKDLLYISTHQWPLFPGTGGPDDQVPGRVLNVPLPAGKDSETDSETFRTAYEQKVFPALEQFRPEFLLISAGFDAHSADPLAQMNLDEDDFRWVTDGLRAFADAHAPRGLGRIVSVLEGGYNIPALKRSVEAHILSLNS